jgi:hypothetical protein
MNSKRILKVRLSLIRRKMKFLKNRMRRMMRRMKRRRKLLLFLLLRRRSKNMSKSRQISSRKKVKLIWKGCLRARKRVWK